MFKTLQMLVLATFNANLTSALTVASYSGSTITCSPYELCSVVVPKLINNPDFDPGTENSYASGCIEVSDDSITGESTISFYFNE